MLAYEESALPAELIRAAQRADENAFNTIIRATKSRLLAMASRYVQSAAELDDLAQDIFIHIWKGLPTYRFDAPFPHWVSRVAVNVCLTHLKKRQRRQHHLAPALDPDTIDRLPDHTLEAHAAAHAAHDRLQPALHSLRPEDRLLITLLHLEEKSVAETAALTGWTPSNVKVRAMRARQKLKEYLTHHEATN